MTSAPMSASSFMAKGMAMSLPHFHHADALQRPAAIPAVPTAPAAPAIPVIPAKARIHLVRHRSDNSLGA